MRHLSVRLTAIAATSALATLSLLGCGSTPAPVPAATGTTEAPVFASDEEALAAATSAYAAYQAMSDSITGDGGLSPDRIGSYVSDEYRQQAIAGFEAFSSGRLTSHGASTYDNVALVQYADGRHGEASVDLYVCSDVSAVTLTNAEQLDVTPSTRPTRIPLQVGFVSALSNPRTLVVDREEVWTGEDFC
jgi:hypothetical protein